MNPVHHLRVAFGLLTTLPVGMSRDWQPGDSGRAGIWFPVVGIVIGVMVWLVCRMLSPYFPPLVVGVLTLSAWIFLTGGLHLDGLADCCDGLLFSGTRERRLEIMNDPRPGTFGIIGLLLVLYSKAVALSFLMPSSGLGIILATTISRWLILPAALLPLAHSEGMGADFARGFKRSAIVITAIFPLGIAFLIGTQSIPAIIISLLAAAAVLGIAYKSIGGVSGDVFGMLVEVTETTMLLSFTLGAI